MASESNAAAEPKPVTTAVEVRKHRVDDQEAERIERMTKALATQLPPRLQGLRDFMEKAAPYIGKLGVGIEIAAPYVSLAIVEAHKFYDKLPTRLAKALWGFGMCFFGGRFPVAIAAIEAFKATGGRQMLELARDLQLQLKTVIQESKRDDALDDDNDGVADVRQMAPSQLAKRKLLLALKTVDPDRFSKAMGGLYAGYMGILVALQFKFARTIALANSIGDQMRPIAAKVLAPPLIAMVPAEYSTEDFNKWIAYGIKFGCKATAMIIAWRVQKIISTVQSGIKGGHILATNLYLYLQEMGKVSASVDDTIADDVAKWSFAMMGIYFQLVKGGRIPFPLDMVMWPLGFIERVLEWNVTWMKADPAIAAKTTDSLLKMR